MNALMLVGNRVRYADTSTTVVAKAPNKYHNALPERNAEEGLEIGVVDTLQAATCNSQPV